MIVLIVVVIIECNCSTCDTILRYSSHEVETPPEGSLDFGVKLVLFRSQSEFNVLWVRSFMDWQCDFFTVPGFLSLSDSLSVSVLLCFFCPTDLRVVVGFDLDPFFAFRNHLFDLLTVIFYISEEISTMWLLLKKRICMKPIYSTIVVPFDPLPMCPWETWQSDRVVEVVCL